MNKQDKGKQWQVAAECTRDGGSSGGCHLPRAFCAQLIHTHANPRVQILGQEALDPVIAGGNAEGEQQEALIRLHCPCTLPSHLLLGTSGNWTVDQVNVMVQLQLAAPHSSLTPTWRGGGESQKGRFVG